MSRAIKLKNNDYLDSAGVVHNRVLLSTILNEFETFKNNMAEIVLYDNNNGNKTQITLSDNVSNYTYIEIYFKNDDNQYGYQKIYSPNNKTTFGTIIRKSGSNANIMLNTALFNISNNTITITRNSQANMFFSGGSNSDSNALYITRVVGHK